MNFIKHLFYKKNIHKNWETSHEETFKQWVIKTDIKKDFEVDKNSIEKAKNALTKLINEENPRASEIEAYMDLRKKYKSLFKQNNNELEQPSSRDVQDMDLISLDEIKEIVNESDRLLFQKYYLSVIEIYQSSRNGVIVVPTLGGLYSSRTPTSDYIDDQVQDHNPFDDTNVD